MGDLAAASLDLESVNLALCAQTTSTPAIVEAFGMISFNQTEQRVTTGVNGSSVPVANVFTINASALATANQISFNLLPGADPNASLVVVNVAGAVDGSFNLTNAVINLNGLPAANVIWTCAMPAQWASPTSSSE